MGPLVSAAAARLGAAATSTSVERRVRRAARPTAPGFWLPPTVVAADDTDERGLARGGLRPGRRGDAVRRRGRGGRAGQRHRVRPVRLDLHQRPRPRRCGSRAASRPATSASTRHSVGALLDAVRRLQAVRPRPRARPGRARTRSPRRRTSSSPTDRTDPRPQEGTQPWQDASRARSPSSPEAARGIGLATVRRFVEEGARVVIGDIDDARGRGAGRRARRRRRGDVRPRRRDRQGRGRRAVPDRQGHLRLGRHRLQQRRHLARRRTTRSSTPTSTPGAGCRRST